MVRKQTITEKKTNHDVHFEGTSIQPVTRISIHEELALRVGSVLLLPSVICNDVIQGEKSETKHMLGILKTMLCYMENIRC